MATVLHIVVTGNQLGGWRRTPTTNGPGSAGRALLVRLRDQRLPVVEQALAGWDEGEARHLVGQPARLETDLLRVVAENDHRTTKYGRRTADEHACTDRKVMS